MCTCMGGTIRTLGFPEPRFSLTTVGVTVSAAASSSSGAGVACIALPTQTNI